MATRAKAIKTVIDAGGIIDYRHSDLDSKRNMDILIDAPKGRVWNSNGCSLFIKVQFDPWTQCSMPAPVFWQEVIDGVEWGHEPSNDPDWQYDHYDHAGDHPESRV